MSPDEFDPDHFAHQLKYYRKKEGLTQAALAARLETDVRNIRRWENAEVRPRPATMQKLYSILKESERSMNRRDLFRIGFKIIPASLLLQESHHLLIKDIVVSSKPVLSREEEYEAIETMVETCWLLLPHFSNIIGTNHLAFVQRFKEDMSISMRDSPNNDRFSKALIQARLVEGRLLYAMKRLEDAKGAYNDAIQLAREKSHYLLTSAGYGWYANFLIDSGESGKALDHLWEARKLAEQGHAPPIFRSWIFATEADAWSNLCYDPHANQEEAKKSRLFLNRALEEMEKPPQARLPFRIPYDEDWMYGYEGTVFAHIGEAQKAQNALKKGLSNLSPQKKVFRQWGFYKDLVISQSQEDKLEEACASAREMLDIAMQTKAPMERHRSIKTINDFLGCWNDHCLVKDLRDEFHLFDADFNY
jgi:transcriptional regulator with XRE-family HTH domain